jgi:PAS domain S-box-containing protein
VKKKPRGAVLAVLLALLLPGALSGGSSGPEAGPPSITVVTDDNYPPYVFRGASGELQGIVPDQWKAWEKATGRKAELVGMEWGAAQRFMNEARADVIDTMFETPERQRLYDFSKPYAKLEAAVFFHKNISGVSKIEDLRGFRVAVKSGDAAIERLRAAGVGDLAEYPSYESIVRAAAAGLVRVFCVDRPPALYFIYKLGIEEDFRSAVPIQGGEFHRAVAKGRGGLLASVQAGFDSIPPSTYAAIDRAWLGASLDRGINPLVFRAAVAAAAVLLVAALLLIGAAAVLRRRVAAATAALRGKVYLVEASEARSSAFIAALPDIFFVLDREGTYLEVGASSPELLALPAESLVGKRMSDLAFAPGFAEELLGRIRRSIDEKRLETCEYEIRVLAGLRRFEGRIVPLGPDRALLVPRDVTDRVRTERLLRASLAEKEVLIREVHHRVKNNLQIISSLIALQEDSFRDERDRELLEQTQNRIRAMARLHELLYRSPDLSSIDAADYLRTIVSSLSDGTGTRIDVRAEPVVISLDQAVPSGLIVTELVTNALKYAYPGGGGPIALELRAEGGSCAISVGDEGVGLPEGFDPEKDGSMGFTLIRSLVSQLQGSMVASRGPGLKVEIRFKLSS